MSNKLEPCGSSPLHFCTDIISGSQKETIAVTERLMRFGTLYPNDASAFYYCAMSLWEGSPGAKPQERLEHVETLLKKSNALIRSFERPTINPQRGQAIRASDSHREPSG